MADKKPSSREQIKQIVAGIEENIQELFQSDKFADYLRTMSKFHNYSYNNSILIHMQMPNATRVAGFNKWKNQFGRHVKKGEKGLTIIAPTPFKKKIEEMKLDPDTRAPVLDTDGKIVMEEREVEIPLFRPVKVFDVSQTDGPPLPSLSTDLTGDVQQYEAFMEALRRTSPVPMFIKPIPENMDGFFRPKDQTITIREGMSQVQTVCAAVHEITHSMLHNREQTRLTANAGNDAKELPKAKDKNTMEVEAESVSYTVCQYYGIDTSANSLGYIATWSKDKTLPELKASLETITKTANTLITSIDRHFAEVCKERGIDLTTTRQPEQTASAAEVPVPAPETAPDTPEQFVSDLMDLIDRLYQAGFIKRNFPADDREGTKANLVHTLAVNPPIVRAVLEKFIKEDTGAEEARALMKRLNELLQTEPLKYVYKIDANPQTVGTSDQHFIQTYERTAEGTLKPDRVLFLGTFDICASLLEKLQSGKLGPDDFVQVSSARISHYTTRDGAELDALVGLDDKVYLGRRDHYDNRGHYINDDKSLCFLSDNEKMFNFISGSGYSDTQTELLEQGYFTTEDYAEFAALQAGVLVQFEETESLLFAGEPFSPSQQDTADLEQTDMLDTTLDEYPMPDNSLTLDDLAELGYSDGDLLPLSQERAAAMLEQDMTVYIVQAGENPEMVFDRDDLTEQPEGAIFAVPREEWEECKDFQQAVADRMQHQEEREQAFLNHDGDCFAIYQIRHDDSEELRAIRFEPLGWLQSVGRTVKRENYELVYIASLPPTDRADTALDQLWEQFNIRHPADYRHHSMSVSDIIALKRDGVVTCHYCDDIGFAQLSDFITQKPTVAELEAQVKAGQTISLTDLAGATHREKDKKSVVAQLKGQPAQQKKRSVPKKSTKKER